MWIATGEQMRELESRVLRETGIPAILWMERAAAAMAREIALCGLDPSHTIVLCGPGNNGGDGLALARMLALQGHQVQVWRVSSGISAEETLKNFQLLDCIPDCFITENIRNMQTTQATLIVDAILGTGTRGPLRGQAADALRWLQASWPEGHPPLVAADIVTGLDATTGQADPLAPQATLTVSFGLSQLGHFLGQGPRLSGRLVVEPLDLPPTALQATTPPLVRLYDRRAALGDLHPIRTDVHKGSRGHVLVVGGAAGTEGAAVLAASGALCAGAGRITLVGSDLARAAALQHFPELMTAPPTRLSALVPGADALVAGPGMGTDDAAAAQLRELLELAGDTPLILDADALTLLATRDFGGLPPATILTPHPGELGRLVGVSTSEAAGALLEHAVNAAERWNATVVAKVAGTLVVDSRRDWIAGQTPALATAGSGDVLAGAIGALACTHPHDVAARLGAWLHQAAGTVAAGGKSSGVTATEIARALAVARLELES